MKLREKIAREIEPKSWASAGSGLGDLAHEDRRASSLQKADSILSILTDPDEETVERVGQAIEKAWNSGTPPTLPPIDLAPDERNFLARAALSSLGEG
jgi:hypothetical protein